MDDINLETVNPHDPQECDAGLKRIRGERDRARNTAVALEQDNADLERRLHESQLVNAALGAKLTAHGIEWPTHDDIEGTPV